MFQTRSFDRCVYATYDIVAYYIRNSVGPFAGRTPTRFRADVVNPTLRQGTKRRNRLPMVRVFKGIASLRSQWQGTATVGNDFGVISTITPAPPNPTELSTSVSARSASRR